MGTKKAFVIPSWVFGVAVGYTFARLLQEIAVEIVFPDSTSGASNLGRITEIHFRYHSPASYFLICVPIVLSGAFAALALVGNYYFLPRLYRRFPKLNTQNIPTEKPSLVHLLSTTFIASALYSAFVLTLTYIFVEKLYATLAQQSLYLCLAIISMLMSLILSFIIYQLCASRIALPKD